MLSRATLWILLFSYLVILGQPSPLNRSCYRRISKECSGNYFDMSVNCDSNSFASVTWSQRNNHDLELDMISIETVCYNTSTNTVVSLETIVTNTDALTSTRKHSYNDNIKEGMVCVFRGCAVGVLDFQTVTCRNKFTANCSNTVRENSSQISSTHITFGDTVFTSSSEVASLSEAFVVLTSTVVHTSSMMASSNEETTAATSIQMTRTTQKPIVTYSSILVTFPASDVPTTSIASTTNNLTAPVSSNTSTVHISSIASTTINLESSVSSNTSTVPTTKSSAASTVVLTTTFISIVVILLFLLMLGLIVCAVVMAFKCLKLPVKKIEDFHSIFEENHINIWKMKSLSPTVSMVTIIQPPQIFEVTKSNIDEAVMIKRSSSLPNIGTALTRSISPTQSLYESSSTSSKFSHSCNSKSTTRINKFSREYISLSLDSVHVPMPSSLSCHNLSLTYIKDGPTHICYPKPERLPTSSTYIQSPPFHIPRHDNDFYWMIDDIPLQSIDCTDSYSTEYLSTIESHPPTSFGYVPTGYVAY